MRKAKTVFGTMAASAAAWTTYSALIAPHDTALPRPVPGEAGHIDSLSAGRVACYEMGRGDGDPVVLVHGVHAAASAYDLRPLYISLAGRGHHVIALDLPGFGQSERGMRRYDQDLCVAAVGDVVEATTDRPVHVVGLSAGAEIAAKLAVQRPDRVRSLTLISPTGLGEAGRPFPVLGRLLDAPVLGQAIFDLLTSRPSIRYFLSKEFSGPVDGGYEAFSWMSAHQPGARHAPAAFLRGAFFDGDITAVYRMVACPAMVIYGADPYAAMTKLPELASVPNWRARHIGDSGMPHFEHTAAVVDAVQRFLTSSESSVGPGPIDRSPWSD